MKRQIMLCALAFALVLTCAHAMAAANLTISNPVAKNGSGAEITEVTAQKFTVAYTGEKEKQYVIMVVPKEGVDAEKNAPTMSSISNGAIVYMNQTEVNADGDAVFTVAPNIDPEKAKKGDEYFVYLSSNEASGGGMKEIGSFTIDELIALLRYLGDVYRDDNADDITILDVQRLLNYVIENTKLTGDDLKAANVDKDPAQQITILDVQRLLNMVITNAPKESIS